MTTAIAKTPNVTVGNPPIQPKTSNSDYPSIFEVPMEFQKPELQYRFVNKRKVYWRKTQGYKHVMYADCPIYDKDASGHIVFADTILMCIEKTRVAAMQKERGESSTARVAASKADFHKAVEQAKIPGLKSFETDPSGKEVF